MKKYYSHLLHNIQIKFRRDKKDQRLERGQVLVIVALSVIGLVAAVGLTVDVGLLYLNHAKLRRSVDAAALAASSQFREGYSTTELSKAAVEFLILNGVNDPSATVETCATTPGDPVLCQIPFRKLVRVRATSVMQLAFMPVIGIRTTTVSASAVSEAASMDVVFVIDTSDSMTYRANPGDPMRDPSQCNPVNDCHPFKEVKEAAKAFVDQLYFPYDRVAIVTFDDGARPVIFSGNFDPDVSGGYEAFSDDRTEVLAAINGLEVVSPGICPTDYGPCRVYERDPVTLIPTDLDSDGVITYFGFDCTIFHSSGNPETCGTTAIGRGLHFAGNEFANPDTFRQESLWVIILLTDGAANGPSYACPNSTWTKPFCRDLSPTSRHCLPGDTSCVAKGGVVDENEIDADDYARDLADFVAEDQDALIFTIGLGNLVKTSEPRARKDDPTVKCDIGDPIDDCLGAGELFLKYAADVGNGKYYFAPSGDQLRDIFLDIAQNLATRLTQ